MATKMNKMKAIQKAVALANKLQHLFVTTADPKGQPHVTAAGAIKVAANGRVEVSSWFCPGTTTNLQHNHRISVVVWDPAEDTGYQLVGEVEKVEESAFLNGYAPAEETSTSSPQVERQLLVRVDKALSFSHAPHSDVEE
jgi:hypothetical protein